MKPRITVVDYGMGNLRSVEKALEKVGASVDVTDSPAHLRAAQAVVLPGVGAFGEAVDRLKRQRLWEPLQTALASGRPFLGICLGLQLLFDRSEESPRIPGLGFLKGSVKRFRFPNRWTLKVPHMGWNTLNFKLSARPALLQGIRARDYFYFVHSFFPVPRDRACIATTTPYGTDFCSAISVGPVFASQFHPEKSGAQGLRILRNFVREAGHC